MNINKKNIKSTVNKTPNLERLFQLSIAIILYAFTLLLVFPSYMQKVNIPSVGEVVEDPIILKHTVKYKNRAETEKLVAYAQASVRPIFEMPMSIKENAMSKISNMFSFMRDSYKENSSIDEIYDVFSTNYNLSINKAVFSNAVIGDVNVGYEDKVVNMAGDFLETGIISRRNLTPDTLSLIMNNGIFVYKFNDSIIEEKVISKNRVHFLEDLRMELNSIVGSRYRELNIFEINDISSIVNVFLQDNLIYDSDRTQEKINEIQSTVEPVYTTIKAGFPILEAGERVTEEKANLLRYILSDNSFFNFSLPSLIGQGFFILILFASLGFIIFYYKICFYTNFKNFLLFAFEYIFIMITAYICSNYVSDKLISVRLPFYIYTFIPMFATLNSLLGAKRGVSSVITLCITVLAANMVRAEIFETFCLFIISIVVSIAAKKINNRNGVLLLGLYLGIYFCLISLLNMFLINEVNFNYMLFILSFVSGLTQAILVMIILPICEYLLETASIFKLQELADLNNPLLRQLQMNAPGTYHHSINMANLVETIAEEIGENARLACVSAYYHDIGKIENPLYFIENSSKNENIHQKLKPTLSASIVKSHVRFGVEIAKKYKLPKEIIAAIKEHHGTSLIKYFYVEAYKEDPNVDIDLFTYPGPRPQSKITAILMILDSIEAASRTLEIPTRENLEKLIENIVDDKMSHGELNDSGLTLKDIEIIKRISFKKIIVSLHERIKYPELPEEKDYKDENANKKEKTFDKKDKEDKTKKYTAKNGEVKHKKEVVKNK